MQKTARRNTHYSKIEKMMKSGKNGHFAKNMVRRNGQNRLILGLKFKEPKTYEKRLYNHIRAVLCKKVARRNISYSKIETISKSGKNGHFAKAIVRQNSQKRPILGLKIKVPKTYEKRLYNHIRVILCKKLLEETPTIPKLRRLRKVAKMAILQRLK